MTCAKEPYISAKEPYVSATYAQERHTCSATASALGPAIRERLMTYAKESYISAKEPYISAKEPYISAKEPYIYATYPRERHTCSATASASGPAIRERLMTCVSVSGP